MADGALSPVLQRVTVGDYLMKNRVVMASLTRSRSSDEGVPPRFAADYYAQHVGAGLIVTEATNISPQPRGYMPPSGEIERQAGVGRCPVRQHHLKSSGCDVVRGRWLADMGEPRAGQRRIQHQAGFVEREGARRIDQHGLAALLEFPAVELSRAHPGPDALMPQEVGRHYRPLPPDEIGGWSPRSRVSSCRKAGWTKRWRG
jgi:hypothetical protein